MEERRQSARPFSRRRFVCHNGRLGSREEPPVLEGLKVVEFATYVAAPSAAMVMADWAPR